MSRSPARDRSGALPLEQCGDVEHDVAARRAAGGWARSSLRGELPCDGYHRDRVAGGARQVRSRSRCGDWLFHQLRAHERRGSLRQFAVREWETCFEGAPTRVHVRPLQAVAACLVQTLPELAARGCHDQRRRPGAGRNQHLHFRLHQNGHMLHILHLSAVLLDVAPAMGGLQTIVALDRLAIDGRQHRPVSGLGQGQVLLYAEAPSRASRVLSCVWDGCGSHHEGHE
mmetsp:Transcript_91525/g.280078  ORF Transcript_91525/g.280078 Transcript_91525/m.280078 type:complete len:228 (-) Transcript_91525:285-968(-)